MTKYKQLSYLLIAVAALFLYIKVADASELAKCYLEGDDNSYYSVDWEIDNGPDGQLKERQFNITFRKMCDSEVGRVVLSSNQPYNTVYNPSRIQFSSDDITIINEPEKETMHSTTYTTLEGIHGLIYAESKNEKGRKNLWWQINSGADNLGKKWDINFNYPNGKGGTHEVKGSAYCKIKYAKTGIRVANLTPQLNVQIYTSVTEKYREKKASAQIAGAAPSCNLL